MANTVFKLRRSSVAGKVPNTSTIAIGELGLNLTDRILYSSDGTNVFEIGANNRNVQVTNNIFIGNSSVNTFINSTSISVGNATVNAITFSNAGITATSGILTWNPDESTLDIGLANGSILQTGQETLYRVKNQTGATIYQGTVVRAAGTVGASGRLLVAPFQANGQFESKYCMGIATSDIVNGGDGYVTHFGKVRGVNTSMWSEGTILYANATDIGALSNVMPKAPNNKITVAIVISSHNQNGTLFVRPTLGSQLHEDEMAEISSLANNDSLFYNSATGRFENKPAFQNTTGTFSGSLTVSGNVIIGNSSFYSATYTSSTTNDQILDSFSNGTFRSAQYMITSKSGSSYETTQLTVLHDDVYVYLSEYGTVTTNTNSTFAGKLGQYSASLVNGLVMINVIPTFAATTFRVLRTTNL